MSTQLSRLYATEISRLQKVEWLENYIKARAIAITSTNILGGWRGSGLFPTNPHRVLRIISGSATPSPAVENQLITPYLISSSPPDAAILRSANIAFNTALFNANIATPIRKHGRRLSGIAEHLHADNSILHRENRELKNVITTRKERLSGKRIILKGKIVVSTEEIHKKLADAERATRERKTKSRRKNQSIAVQEEEVDDHDIVMI
jgi:hypothetical protein